MTNDPCSLSYLIDDVRIMAGLAIIHYGGNVHAIISSGEEPGFYRFELVAQEDYESLIESGDIFTSVAQAREYLAGFGITNIEEGI